MERYVIEFRIEDIGKEGELENFIASSIYYVTKENYAKIKPILDSLRR